MVADASGVLLVPSFAIGRTQEIVWALDRLLEAGKIPQLPLYLDSPMASKATDIYRRHAEYFDEETRRLLAARRHAARLPEPDRDPRRPRLADDRPGAAAVHDRRLERDADRRPGPRPPAQPDRRPGRDAAVRRLPGRGHARRPSPGRREDRQARRPGPREVRCKIRSISGFSRPRRRARAARLARPLRRGQEGRRAGFPKTRLPRPRRSRGPDRDGAEGPGARLHDEDPALARDR